MLSGTFVPEDRDAVLFVDGASSPATIAVLGTVDRTTGWIAAIDPHRLSVAGVPAFLRGLATLGERNDVAQLVVTAPDERLELIAQRARVTVNRLALPVGQGGGERRRAS